MKIVAIRHTTPAIEPGICYGQSDLDVADSYSLEKNKTEKLLNEYDVDVVFSSPLIRCKKLANDLFVAKGINFDDRLKELNFGDWELKTWDEIYASEDGKVWMDNYQSLPTLNGESYPEMVSRIEDWLAEIKKENYKVIAVVAHAGVIRILKSLIEKQAIDELFKTFKPDYGSVTEFEL